MHGTGHAWTGQTPGLMSALETPLVWLALDPSVAAGPFFPPCRVCAEVPAPGIHRPPKPSQIRLCPSYLHKGAVLPPGFSRQNGSSPHPAPAPPPLSCGHVGQVRSRHPNPFCSGKETDTSSLSTEATGTGVHGANTKNDTLGQGRCGGFRAQAVSTERDARSDYGAGCMSARR